MVFLGGPRQVGKTTLAQSLIPKYRDGHPAYLNWDDIEQRKRILAKEWPRNEKLIVLDEVHKFKSWRNLVKGFYDTLKHSHQFLITGSAKLDYFKKGGDSLLGRFHYHRLHPFSFAELKTKESDIEHLLHFGGFPEPFLKGHTISLKRWHLQRKDRIIYGDVRDLENIREISSLELLVDALAERVGSPLSRKSLGEDLEVDQKTVETWLKILERVYYCYRIAPFGAPSIRAVKKEQKLYLWDWSEHEDSGKRWENFVASHLLKFCHHRQDVLGDKMELRFLRDAYRREVDFVVLKDGKPLFAVECKAGERQPSPHLKYFAERTKISYFYQVHQGTREAQVSGRISLMPFARFSEEVGLV
ncbi:MAG: ATP-binding protein [Bradymonadales bacterium]|nr:MAG: ATP-binding protein [Bradymonadales bacterium]